MSGCKWGAMGPQVAVRAAFSLNGSRIWTMSVSQCACVCVSWLISNLNADLCSLNGIRNVVSTAHFLLLLLLLRLLSSGYPQTRQQVAYAAYRDSFVIKLKLSSGPLGPFRPFSASSHTQKPRAKNSTTTKENPEE